MIYLLTDLLFPSRCAGCGGPARGTHHCLCPGCTGRLVTEQRIFPTVTETDNDPSARAWTDRRWYLSRSISLSEYSGITKNVICAMKFGGMRSYSAILGDRAVNELKQNPLPINIITWVPLNSKKKWQRGFNQSELIASHVSKKTGIPAQRLLREIAATRAQKKLGLRDRFINALNRYEISPRSGLSGKRILIIDDVYTTGATLNECARQLHHAGAEEVFSMTMARTDIKRLEKF